MGVDYYKCTKCQRMFSDYGDYGTCEQCERHYCEYCFAELRDLYNHVWRDDIEGWDAPECYACSDIVEIRCIFRNTDLLAALLAHTGMTRQQVVDMVTATLSTSVPGEK